MTIFEQYAILDNEEKALKERKEVLRATIIAQMASEYANTAETAVGKFSITKLKKWTYPEAVEELGEKFKAAKAKAESTGDATYEEQDSLRFTAVKL